MVPNKALPIKLDAKKTVVNVNSRKKPKKNIAHLKRGNLFLFTRKKIYKLFHSAKLPMIGLHLTRVCNAKKCVRKQKTKSINPMLPMG